MESQQWLPTPHQIVQYEDVSSNAQNQQSDNPFQGHQEESSDVSKRQLGVTGQSTISLNQSFLCTASDCKLVYADHFNNWPELGAWTRPEGAAATAAWGIDGLAVDIQPAIALGGGETTGWKGCKKKEKVRCQRNASQTAVKSNYSTYTMATKRRKNTRFRNRSGKRGVSWGWGTCSVIRRTSMISKECFDIRVWAWILAQLMLPVKTAKPSDRIR